MPLDHFSINVPSSKLEALIAWLTSSCEHLGIKEMMRPAPHVVGLGDKSPFLWINAVGPDVVDEKTMEVLSRKLHVAFKATTAEQVKKFHAAGLKAGGEDNGPAGFRPNYYPGYFGAFVRDPGCGINFEVVCHNPDDVS